MKHYFVDKLSGIVLRMDVHPGDASTRLASEASGICLLPSSEIPQRHRNRFDKLREILIASNEGLPHGVHSSRKVKGITNNTAAKYIGLLKDILDETNEQQE